MEKLLEKIKDKTATIEIFGLGYVGFPLAVKLASKKFNVVGIDINSERINRLKKNELLDSEKVLTEEFIDVRKEKLILSEISIKNEFPKIGIICVPTPIPGPNIDSDVFVKKAVENFLNFAKQEDCIILESSIEVGTTEKIEKIIENKGFNRYF